MTNIVIIGAGGFGREVQWLIERINEQEQTWNILGYVDDGMAVDTNVDGYRVLGGIDYLRSVKENVAVVCAIGSSKTRKKVISRLLEQSNITFPNLVDPSVIMSGRIKMGQGNIICASNILTVDIEMGDFNIINLDCTVGHDVMIDSFVTVYPSVNISGMVEVGSETELGTGTQIIQGKKIGGNIIVGAGSVVVKDILETGTYIGIPARIRS